MNQTDSRNSEFHLPPEEFPYVREEDRPLLEEDFLPREEPAPEETAPGPEFTEPGSFPVSSVTKTKRFFRNIMFYAAALIWSVAYGILMPSFTGMIVRAVPESRRGVAASMTGICGDVGMVVGSTVGGYIADAWGYPVMYLSVLVPVVLCCIYYRVNLDGKYKPYDAAADGNDPQIGGGGS